MCAYNYRPNFVVGKEPRVATVMNNAMLDAILADVRPLIGRGKVADYIPALARSAAISSAWLSVRSTGSTIALATRTSVSLFNLSRKS
jgi:hypothetical protein